MFLLVAGNYDKMRTNVQEVREMMCCIKKAVQTGRKVDIIYLAESGSVSKRTIRIISYTDDHIIAFCYMRNQMRTFKNVNILAMEQSQQKLEGYAS